MAGQGEYVIRVTGDVREVLNALRETERAAEQTGQKVAKGLSSGLAGGTALKSAGALASELERLGRIQSRVRVEGVGFEQLERRAQGVRQAIEALERRRLLITADPSSIAALQNRLGTLNGQLQKVAIGSREFRNLQKEIRGVERELAKAGEAGGLAAKGASAFQGVLSSLAGLGVGFSIAGFFKGAIDGAVQLETTTRKLSNTLGAQGATAALSFTRKLSDDLGLSFTVLSDSFSRFTAAASAANVPIETQRNLFAAVSKAAQALGLSNDEINGSLLALQQVASKGTVAMEELRGQLGERLPIALSATARGLGITQRELIKLVESGKLTAGEFFPALTKGLNELTDGAGGVPTAAQNFQKLQNAWEDLQRSFGVSLLPTVIGAVKQLNEALKELKVNQKGRDLGLDGGFLGGISNGAAQVVGEVDRLQQKYNLTDEKAKELFETARKTAGVTRGAFGRIFGQDQYDRLLETLPGVFEKAAAGAQDLKGQELAAASAAAARADAESKALDQQVKSVELAKRGDRVRATEAEVSAIQRLTLGVTSAAKVEEEQGRRKREDLRRQIAIEDELIGRLERNGGASAELLKAQERRGASALELAQAERQELDRVKQRLQERIQQEQQLTAAIFARPASIAGQQQEVGQALLNLSQALSELEQSRFGIATARGKRELEVLQQRGASEAVLNRKRQEIDAIERQALTARSAALVQAQALEAKILQLKQAQARVEGEGALLTAQANLLREQQKLAEARRTGDPEEVARQRAVVAISALGVDNAARRLAVLQQLAPLERAVSQAQQEAARNGIQAEAVSRGWADATLAVNQALATTRFQFLQVGDTVADLGVKTKNYGIEAQNAGQGLGGAVDPTQAIAKFLSSGSGEAVSLSQAMTETETAASGTAATMATIASSTATAATNARAFYDWLSRASSVPQGRFTGGPVEPGTTYRVNELGREAFLSAAGRLTEINRPANALWTPPGRGTVIPAGVTTQLREAGALGAAAGAGGGFRGDGGMALMAAELGMLRQEVRALRQKEWGVRVVNEAGGATLIDRMTSLL